MSTGVSKSQAFTTPGAITFNVPATVSCVEVTLVGGGGGGCGVSADVVAKPGGGSAEFCVNFPYAVTAGGTVSGVVGSGGAGGIGVGFGSDGGATSFGSLAAVGGSAATDTTNGGRGGNNLTGLPGADQPGITGLYEFGGWCSGSHGAGGNGSVYPNAQNGAAAPGLAAPIGGLISSGVGWGSGGGAATPWGGTNGNAGDSSPLSPASSAYGCGGPGAGGKNNGDQNGSAGGNGYILVVWVE